MIVSEQGGFRHLYSPGDEPTTMLVALHGTGGSAEDAMSMALDLRGRLPCLAPQGRVMEGPNRRWFRRFADGSFDQEDLRERTAELAEFLNGARQRYGAERLVAVGYSNGANVAASVILGKTRTLAGAALLRGTLPFVPDPEPDLRGTRVLNRPGEDDPYCPRDKVDALDALLRRCGAEVDLQWSPLGHGLNRDDFAAVRAWLSSGFGA